MGISGLIPFLEKASRRANVDEFTGCTVAIDTYCWLHKGAFACADKLVRKESTDIHIKYCLKYVTMLLSRNIKPILVFDGRHLPAKAMTEAKRRETRNISKKRAAELLSLGQIEEARSFLRRSVDITHEMALQLIKECRSRNVDCIVAPYEADSQLAYLNTRNIAHLVVTEDSDLVLFGCTKVLFKMDLEGNGTLVETAKLPLVMRCPIERYTFDKFRQMCIISGCDYLASLPGIGLAKARQFITTTQDSNIANALKKLPSFFNKSSLIVTDEYRENFLKAEATFKHQYVYDPIDRRMVRLNEVDDEDVERALCSNAGELLDPEAAFQLALGNLDPFTMRQLDTWHPDSRAQNEPTKRNGWSDRAAPHPSIWSPQYKEHLQLDRPWAKKTKRPDPIIPPANTRPRKKVVNLLTRYVPETQNESLTIEDLSSMYCVQPPNKRQKMHETSDLELNSQDEINKHDKAMIDDSQTEHLTQNGQKSPIIQNRERSYAKCIKNGEGATLKRLSRFPRTVLGENVVESKFFSSFNSNNANEDANRNIDQSNRLTIDSQIDEIPDSQADSGIETLNSSQKENSPNTSPVKSPILEPSPRSRNPFRVKSFELLEVVDDKIVIENSSVESFTIHLDTAEITLNSSSQDQAPPVWRSKRDAPAPIGQPSNKKLTCRVPGLRRPANQPTLLSKFGFQKKPVLKKSS